VVIPNNYVATSFQEVNQTFGYTNYEPTNIRTLSTNTAEPGGQLTGLVFVPDLPKGNACINASSPYVPTNVTRLSDLPSGYGLIAVAPWLSPECTLAYLSAARSNPSVQSFIFFLTGQGNAAPPTANDAAWSLGDGGQWKSQNEYPVYAIPTDAGSGLLQMSGLYSGSMKDVPFGANLTKLYNPDYYIRLFAEINTGGTSGLPSLWVFLLIILAVLLVIVGIISFVMHVVQRRRRENLRRRMMNGEVDLASLGIKKFTVPQEELDKMPLYVYGPTTTVDEPQAETTEKSEPTAAESHTSAPITTAGLHQPVCAICLEDFVPSETSVRELPCRHIFHPECCDAFLRDNSSLCPLCKKSALPKGFCPTVLTNAMVRRERILRRTHTLTPLPANTNVSTSRPLAVIWREGLFGRSRYAMRGSGETGTEMNTVAAPPLDDSSLEAGLTQTAADMPPAPPPEASATARREWARRRAIAMVGPRVGTDREMTPQSENTPGWRKWVRGIFPS